jgi:hypothetical protein
MVKKLKIKEQMAIITQNLDKIGNTIARQNSLDRERIDFEKSKFMTEQKNKDRVDISLKHYEEMKRMIEILEEQNERYKAIFERMCMDKWVDDIEPSTIEVATMKDPVRLSTRVHIQFESKRHDYF